ncbi:sterol desaturase family protein [Maritalea mediterranea]|uniref:Sterol desaturase family protein n=1 Tax=Maritalea mediterranea TaxID=2909667 RepID=A0ABS9E7Y4_9HYPH|nr:sterol desaturase family protein [Maritalea mediterranea]MCF4098993.1 sterol desaturase family protein [Maritalea mediterranea]
MLDITYEGLNLAEFGQQILYFISLDQTHWIATLALILFFFPLERLFPKVVRNTAFSRISVVLILAICANFTIWLIKNTVYFDIIRFYLNLQIYSISKAPIPTLLIYAICFLAIDLAVYIYHLLSHKITPLWKLHSIHHADETVDASTGILQHPFETVGSLLFVLLIVVAFGFPVLTLVVFTAAGTLHNMFSHANIALPVWVDRILRLVIVTPDMHRTHHSIDLREGNANFGQIFSFWDRMFGTYIDRPASGEADLIMGLPVAEKPKSFTVRGLLFHPFAGLVPGRKGTKRPRR